MSQTRHDHERRKASRVRLSCFWLSSRLLLCRVSCGTAVLAGTLAMAGWPTSLQRAFAWNGLEIGPLNAKGACSWRGPDCCASGAEARRALGLTWGLMFNGLYFELVEPTPLARGTAAGGCHPKWDARGVYSTAMCLAGIPKPRVASLRRSRGIPLSDWQERGSRKRRRP